MAETRVIKSGIRDFADYASAKTMKRLKLRQIMDDDRSHQTASEASELFDALKKTLDDYQVPPMLYTLFGVKNETTCLTCENGTWCVFFSERGMRTGEKRTDNPDEACLAVLYAMAESKEEYGEMTAAYREIVRNSRKTPTVERSEESRRYRMSNLKSLQYTYVDSKQRKRDFRKLWITRISAACKCNGISYIRFMYGLKKAGVSLSRKMLSETAINDPSAFTALVERAKEAIAQ